MQHVTATVRLGGEMNFAIPKPNLTVAEVVLLRLLHGNDAVVDVRPLGTSKRTLRGEKDRLLGQYGHKPSHVEVIDKMFANTAVQPLESLEDIGVDPSTKPAPKVKVAAVEIKAGDFKPYDDAEDVELSAPELDSDDEITGQEPLDEVEMTPAPAAAEPVDEASASALIEEGKAAAKAARRK